jgi:hypothetical protein
LLTLSFELAYEHLAVFGLHFFVNLANWLCFFNPPEQVWGLTEIGFVFSSSAGRFIAINSFQTTL